MKKNTKIILVLYSGLVIIGAIHAKYGINFFTGVLIPVIGYTQYYLIVKK